MKKKILIPIVATVVVGALIGSTFLRSNADKLPQVETTALEVTDLVNTINVTGMVQSENSVNVYSTLSAPIKTVHVEVGDVVAEGDLLLELDVSDLEINLAQQKAALSSQKQKAQHSLAVAKKELATSEFNKKNNYNTTLISARNALDAAKTAQRKAVIDLNNAKEDRRDLRDDAKQVDDDETFDEVLERSHRNIIALEIALEQADQQVENAEVNLRAAEMAYKEELIRQKDTIRSSELANDFVSSQIEMQKLENDLQEGVIKAPASGTVTAVYATEGAVPSGILVVIEDSESLKVITKIKEYDLPNISEGNVVEIKSDGVGGDVVYEGTVAKVAPTSLKTPTGTQVDTTDAEFETEVSVTSKPNKLRIGMNARLSIIVDEKKGVFALPYDAIVTQEDGSAAVLIARAQEDGTYIAEAVPITTGLETDFSIEIISPDLKAGDLVIMDAGITPGSAVALMQNNTEALSEVSKE